MAIAAQSTLLKIESTTPGTYTTIGEITQITGPTRTQTVLGATAMADARQRRGMGLIDLGTVTVEAHLNYGDSGQDRVRTVEAAKTRANWQIAIPAGALGSGASSSARVEAFAGFISNYSISMAMDGVARMTITIALDGDTETATILSAFATAPSSLRAVEYDNLISALRSCGAWERMTACFVLAAADTGAALINLRSTGVSATTSGGPVFTADRGYVGDGTDAIVLSGYTINATTGFSQNDAHVGVYGAWLSAADGPMMGHGGASGSTTIERSGGALVTRLNCATATTGASITDGAHHILLSRSSSGSYVPYVDGVAQTTASQTSSSPVAQQFAGLRITTSYASSNVRLSAMHFGSALTATQAAAVSAAFGTYMTSIGAGP